MITRNKPCQILLRLSSVLCFLLMSTDATAHLEGPKMNITTVSKNVEAVVLGTGGGTTALLHGEPSSSIVIRVDGKCRLLIDAGLGVTSHLLKVCDQEFPSTVFISHNHSDHSGEFPVMAIVTASMKRRIRTVCGPEVAERLKKHRLHEALSAGFDPETIVDWVIPSGSERVKIDDDFEMLLVRGLHAEISYGFVLYLSGFPILGYTGDSGFNLDFYKKLSISKILMVDARKNGTSEHAGFDEVLGYQKISPGIKVLVYGFGQSQEGPANGLEAMKPGESITLFP